ncbi:hypothetical protein FB004_12320 [Sinorhizobium medicae]|nr:hypothetical protein FB004_12320 [Sinorhizobium medicae]
MRTRRIPPINRFLPQRAIRRQIITTSKVIKRF